MFNVQLTQSAASVETKAVYNHWAGIVDLTSELDKLADAKKIILTINGQNLRQCCSVVSFPGYPAVTRSLGMG